MSVYRAPLRDMQFALRELAGIEQIAALPGCEETLDVLDSILERNVHSGVKIGVVAERGEAGRWAQRTRDLGTASVS